jgi:hypothetical protein
MKKLRERDGIETRSNKRAVNRHDRLSSAQEALEKLKSREKIPEDDRSSMALNLGKMIADAQKKDCTLTFSRLFKEAFGEERGVSFFKKKDRLICMPGQKPGKTHYSMGLHYLDLLKTLVSYIELPEAKSDEEQLRVAVLRLIEGTSYDYRGGYVDRTSVEYRKAIDKVFDKLVETVESQVNLDWMREWIIDNPLKIEGKTGVASTINLRSEYDLHYGGDALYVGGPLDSCLAPCVRIASLYRYHEVQKYICIEVNKDASAVSMRDILDAIEHLISEPGGLKHYSEKLSENYEKFLQYKGWQVSPGDKYFRDVKVQTLVDVELRYDEDLAKWTPLALLRLTKCNGNAFGDNEDVLPNVYSRDGKKVFEYFSEEGPESLYAVEDTVENGKTSYIVFEAKSFFNTDYLFVSPFPFVDSEDSKWNTGDAMWSDGCGFCPPESGFYELLLAKFDGRDFERNVDCEIDHLDPMDSPPARYVRAPANTLAYWIMRNMAYAPVEQRLDRLLLKDAKEKYEKLKSFSETIEREYEEAIGSL